MQLFFDKRLNLPMNLRNEMLAGIRGDPPCVADRDVRMMECSSNTSLALEVFSGFERIFPRGVIDEFSVMSPC